MLFDRKMVVFDPSPKVVNGCFATPKTGGAQRFVFDGRPANALFAPSPTFELPTPDLLAQLEVRPGEEVYVAKADLDNYYHRIRLPEWMRPYMALPPVKAGEVGQGHIYGHDALIYPCCTTLPMGWSHSAFLAQKAHENVVRTKTILDEGDLLTFSSDRRIDRPRYFIYIDDMSLIGPSHMKTELEGLLDDYLRSLLLVGLPPKPSKTVRPSADGVVCVGVEIHGRDLTLGVSPSKLRLLGEVTTGLLAKGFCTGSDMERLIGHWTWAFMPRRAAFSVFSAVYRFVEAAGGKTFEIWPSVAKELSVAVGLSPLLFASLDASWMPDTVATDASMWGMGMMAAPVGPEVCREMAVAPPPVGPVAPDCLQPVAFPRAHQRPGTEGALHGRQMGGLLPPFRRWSPSFLGRLVGGAFLGS